MPNSARRPLRSLAFEMHSLSPTGLFTGVFRQKTLKTMQITVYYPSTVQIPTNIANIESYRQYPPVCGVCIAIFASLQPGRPILAFSAERLAGLRMRISCVDRMFSVYKEESISKGTDGACVLVVYSLNSLSCMVKYGR